MQDAKQLMKFFESNRSYEALPHLRVLELHAAATTLDLHSCRDVLLAGIDANIAASLPSMPDAAAQLLSDLNALNHIQTRDALIPLVTWLLNAIMLRQNHVPTDIFRRALRLLDPVHGRGAPSPAVPIESDVVEPTPREYGASLAEGQDRLLLELAMLRAELASQVGSIRRILETITSTSALGASGAPPLSARSESLSFLEGVWKIPILGSTFCVRILNGELCCPYSYGVTPRLTGEVYNWKRVGDSIFAKFRWFNAPPRGYVYFQIKSEDRLAGEWWYSEDVPDNLIDQLPNLGGGNSFEWILEQSSSTPEWAERFFSHPSAAIAGNAAQSGGEGTLVRR